MATKQSTGDSLHACASSEMFPGSIALSRYKQRKCRTGITRCIARMTLVCVVVAICALAIWTESPALTFKECFSSSWIKEDFVERTQTPYMFVYLFNWTNMYDPMNSRVKPNFVQLGPYVFRANGDMPDVRWADNDTLTSCTRTWHFEEDMSTGALWDLISIYHPPDLNVANRIRSWNKYMKKVIDFTLGVETGCMKLDSAVRQWIFKGYFDPLIEIVVILESEIIPWYFREYDMFIGETNDFKTDANETFTYGSCLTEGPLYMLHSNVEKRGNYMNFSGMDEGYYLSDDDILDIFKDISEFYVPIVIVTEREEINETVVLLQKLACCWIDSYFLMFGTITMLILLNSLLRKVMQTKKLCVVRNQN